MSDDKASESEMASAHNAGDDATSDSSSLLIENNNASSQRATPSPYVLEPREIQSGLGPLYLLNQLKRDAQFEVVTDEQSSSTTNEQREFKFAVVVDGQRFIGTGRNKRIAKTRAAQYALEKLFGMCFDKDGKKTNIYEDIDVKRIVII